MKTRFPRSILTVALVIGLASVASSLQGATRFIVSGKIETVTKDSKIALFAERPFYGPPTAIGFWALWNVNKHTLFTATVPIAIPITLDGKRAGFGDLKAGQYVVVEYELVVEEYLLVFCAATRIDAHTTPPVKSGSQQNASKKHK